MCWDNCIVRMLSKHFKIFAFLVMTVGIFLVYNTTTSSTQIYLNKDKFVNGSFGNWKNRKLAKSSSPGFGSLILKLFHARSISDRRSKSSGTLDTKLLSYSFFGANALKKYEEDIRSVAKESVKSSLYGRKEGWQVRIYTDVEIPAIFVEELQSINPRLSFVNVTGDDGLRGTNAMTWRFTPMSDPSVDVVCFRDLDSPLYKREEAAVREFLASDSICHVMRDNPNHSSRIMGGMWCLKNKGDRQLAKTLLKRILQKAQRRVPNVREANKGDDQLVLNTYVWPVIMSNTMVHDSFFCEWPPGGRPFPTKRHFKEPFVGCAFRPCTFSKKELRCPHKCRPRLHQDWRYC